MNKFLKSNLKVIIPVLGLILLGSVSVQSQNSVQNQNLVCDTKIPIGESVDRTSDLLNDIYVELETIYRTIPRQIEGAQEMIKATQKCNLDNCQPVCVDISCYEEDFGCGSSCVAKCVEKTCKGKICPDLEITNQLVNDSFEKISRSFEQINNLYGNSTEEIKRKLDQARIEFNNCAKVAETKAIRCRDIFDQKGQFPLEKIEECKSVCEGEEKTTEKCLGCICGSSINYFCCH